MWDLTNVKETTAFTVIPKGEYLVSAKAGELKATKAGDGSYVKVEFTVIEGEYTGRKIWMTFNVINPNPIAVEIGMAQLKGFFKAAGLTESQMKSLKPESFAGQSAIAIVDIETDSYGEKNKIKAFKPALTSDSATVKPKSTSSVPKKMSF